MELPKAAGGPLGPKWERGRAGSVSPTLEETFFPFVLQRRDSYAAELGPLAEEEESRREREDLPGVLRQKEKDLHLAAELGKALLERNEVLVGQKELLEQEGAQKMEHLEQEKHEQRRKFEARESEWEARVMELEHDLALLSGALDRQQSEQRDTDRERTQAVRELAEQNQRLVEQLSKADKDQHRLRSQLHALQDDTRDRSLASAEHLSELQNLQVKNRMFADRRWEVEQRNKSLMEEKEILQSGVETLQGSLLLLQQHNKEQDLQLQQVQSDLEQEKTANRQLRDRVREMNDEISLHELNTLNNSLQSEIQDMMEGDAVSESMGESTSFSSVTSSPDHVRSRSEELRSLREIHRQDEVALKNRGEQIQRLEEQIRLQVVQMAALKEETESLRQLARAGDRDQVLQQAINNRDEAIRKKNEVELELVRGRIERESISRQLLHTIQQKIELAQELEAWQEDMQIIISQQLKTQHQREQRKEGAWSRGRVQGPGPNGGSSPARDPRGIFSLFKKN